MGLDPTKNGGTVRIFIGGGLVQLKTVVLSEYSLEETGSDKKRWYFPNIYWRRLDPTKNGGTVRIFIGGDWIQLKTVVLSEYLLEGTGSN